MTDDTDRTTEEAGLPRRTFLKASGAAAGAAALGSTQVAAAEDASLDTELLNPRVQEAMQVWERGYTGRTDRSIGLTDSGIETRHPDLGPWNGVKMIEQAGELKATTQEAVENQETERLAAYASGDEFEGIEEEPTRFERPVGPGTFVEGTETVLGEFGADAEASIPDGAGLLNAKLYWEPFRDNANDLELRLDRKVGDGEWEEVARAATAGMPEVITDVGIDPDGTYRYVAEAYKNVQCDARMAELFRGFTPLEPRFDGGDEPFDAIAEQSGPGDKTVGWFDAGGYEGINPTPADPDGHGSHCASIMGGTGQASVVDTSELTTEEPRAVLVAGDFLSYEVTAQAGSGIFASATGNGFEIILEGPDGQQLERSGPPSDVEVFASPDRIGYDANGAIYEDSSVKDNIILSHPTEHGSGEATYTVYVRPNGGESVSTARVEQVAVAPFERPGDVASAGGDLAASGQAVDAGPSVNAGVAPDTRLVGLQGLGGPLPTLADYGQDMTQWFGLRSVNMSWGYALELVGLPIGVAGGTTTDDPFLLKSITENGILVVASAGNSFAPAFASTPGAADEAISVVATDTLDGIVEFSSGGTAPVDEDGEPNYLKPDVTAPGGTLFDNSILAAAADVEDNADGVRDYYRISGTSMSSPYVNGIAGLVSEAMEFDAPDSIALPAPADTGFDDVMRLKQAILATASETAFTAAPYHRAHAPTYEFGERDLYEGYGRANPDAAVDAVSRDLLPGAADLPDDGSTSESYEEFVGLDVPADPRAVAGYVQTRGGTLDVSVEFSHYAGGNKGMTKGDPHVDLFVYDAENPADNGEPNVVTRAQGRRGSASVSVDVPTADAGEEPTERTYYVVAKLVNVPGVVNGFDVQAHLDLDVSFAAGSIPPVTSEFSASGSRSTNASVYTGGQPKRVEVTVDGLTNADAAKVKDRFPEGWEVDENAGDVQRVDEEDNVVTFEGTVTESEVTGDGEVSFVYYAIAPEGAENTRSYTFGPAFATVVDPDVPGDDTDGELDGDKRDDVGGSNTARVVGPSTEP